MNGAGLRIGLVGPLPPPSGGMANQTLQLARLLREEGATVEVIQVNGAYRPAFVGRLKGVRAVFRLAGYVAALWRSASRVDVYHVMANSGWSWHLFAAPAIWIAHLRGKPTVVNYRGGEADAFFARSFRIVKPSLDRSSAIVVPTGFLEHVFGKRGCATTVVPNIIDLGRFSAAERAAVAAIPHAPCILVARNLEPIYDNATALRAFRLVRERLPDARLVIAGSGPERAMLEELAASLGLADAVRFTGRVENADMAKLYYGADVMVNPSLADNMPNSVLEALACGVPVVSTNVGGVPYLVEDGRTARLVPPQDPAAMADAIVAVLTDAALARRLHDAGLELVGQYTWPKVRARLFRIYDSVLQRAPRPAVEYE